MRTPDGSSGVVASATSTAAAPNDQNQTTYLNLITQMQREGQYFASLAHLDSYEARFGHSPESTLLRGDGQRLTNQPDAAAITYETLKTTPLASAGYRGLSLLAGARGDFSAAAALMQEAVKLNSTDAVALGDLGYARMKLGDLAGARIPLMTAAQLAPTSPKVMGNLALFLILDGDRKGADGVMKSANMNEQTQRAIYAQAEHMGAPAAVASTALVVAPLTEESGSHPAIPKEETQSGLKASLRIDFGLASSPVLPSVTATADQATPLAVSSR